MDHSCPYKLYSFTGRSFPFPYQVQLVESLKRAQFFSIERRKAGTSFDKVSRFFNSLTINPFDADVDNEVTDDDEIICHPPSTDIAEVGLEKATRGWTLKLYHQRETLALPLSDVAAVAEWYRYRTVACLVTSSSPVPLKTRRVGQRCTINLSRAETSSRWCGVVVRRGGASSGVVHVT
ncbi:uncharacterized protein TNCV_1684041 [Trichonephila clavipes]|nr:uncharacterized protein TNCV_1684041 [Trichonephila clavipes]